MKILNKFRLDGKIVTDVLMLVIIFILIFLVWWYASSWIDGNIKGVVSANETDAQARGLFGDKFGAVNSLFSGFAFAGIIFTILLQRRDLTQTRIAFEEQTKIAEVQRFDNTFFNLLDLHNSITEKLVDLGGNGRSAFCSFNEKLLRVDADFPAFSALSKLDREKIRIIRDCRLINTHLYPELNDADVSNIESSLQSGTSACDNYLDTDTRMHEEKIRKAYTKSAISHIDNYSHYFRNLYNLFLFIDKSACINDVDRLHYAKIVRSQLSEPELVALFYNSLTKIELPGRDSMELGYPKMGRLLVRYDILQNMSSRSIIHSIHMNIFKSNNKESQ
jgi:hypothetical protein